MCVCQYIWTGNCISALLFLLCSGFADGWIHAQAILIGLKSQMCQGRNTLFSYSVWDKRYRKDLEENDRMMKKNDASKTFNFGLLKKSDCKNDNHVEGAHVHSERWGSELRQETGSGDHSENSDPGACLMSSWHVRLLVKEEIKFLKFCFKNDNGNCIITITHI